MELVRIFGQVCQAAAFAHSQGVIHRDLKPANVMVGSFGEVQVMEWGFAKNLGEASREGEAPAEPARPEARPPASVTRSGSLMGTPAWRPDSAGWPTARAVSWRDCAKAWATCGRCS